MDINIETVVAEHAEKLLLKACHFAASDIHLMPSEKHYIVKFRKFGKLMDAGQYPEALGTRIISYFKFLAAIDIGEKRKPQSGAFQQILDEKTYSFRISTLPSVFQKESLVIRIIKQCYSAPLSSLCFFKEQADELCLMSHERQGLVLFTGATGTGKSTTLYSMIQYCQKALCRHVISLEDPVEIAQDELLQIQVNERAGITYAAGLRAILRHSPDVIMIGEIRDKETAKIAVEAALTGHLVLSTVHAKDTVSCIYRMLDLSVSIEELRQTLIGIVAQSLVQLKDVDERKAVFEILKDLQLVEAIQQTMAGLPYIIAEQQQLTYKIDEAQRAMQHDYTKP
ncbi:MAG: competence type IV pilus ATPase ComGA [Lysinibacillus sp.]